ncbi:hypothetical protein HMPREF9309_00976, partial [Campylobacter ureolyticus ACS-301-V-Sch3b]
TKVVSRRQINQRVSGSDIDLKDIYDNLDEPTYLRYKAD